LAFAVIESTLSVFGSIWILGAAQQHVWSFSRWGPALRRSSYAAFLVQGPILIGIAVALRPLEVVAEVKAAIVASGGVAGSFALAWLLIRSVPPLARVL
jgi:glucans biosynthesis protein C